MKKNYIIISERDGEIIMKQYWKYDDDLLLETRSKRRKWHFNSYSNDRIGLCSPMSTYQSVFCL